MSKETPEEIDDGSTDPQNYGEGTYGEGPYGGTAASVDDPIDAGIRYAGPTGHFDTIQACVDDAPNGGQVVVTGAYDADSASENFPIVIDRREKEVSLRGTDASGSEVWRRDAEGPVLEVIGRGTGDRRNTMTIRDLKFRGGTNHIRLLGAAGAHVENTRHLYAMSHAVSLEAYEGMACNSTTFVGAKAWSCGGTGFYCAPEGGTHGTDFTNCETMWNGWGPGGPWPGAILRGHGTSWHGGAFMRNSAQGFYIIDDDSIAVRDAYLESNGIEMSHSINFHVVNCRGAEVAGLYLNGARYGGNRHMVNANDHDQTWRGGTLNGTVGASVRNCVSGGHRHAFIAVQGSGAKDNDVHFDTHTMVGDDYLVHDRGERTRSSGVILPQRLDDVDGAYPGDRGIDTQRGLIGVWHGGKWHFRDSGSSDGGDSGSTPVPTDPSITRGTRRIMRGTPDETTVHTIQSSKAGPTTFVIGGIHGDEPSGYLAADTIAKLSGLNSGRLVTLPRANVVAIKQRRRGQGWDLNRAFPTGSRPTRALGRAIWDEIEREDPDLIIDLHSSGGYRSDGSGQGQAHFPTSTGRARTIAPRLNTRLNEKFGFTGRDRYVTGNTLTGANPLLVHKVAGDLKKTGFLIETYRYSATASQQAEWHIASVINAMREMGHELPAPVRRLG